MKKYTVYYCSGATGFGWTAHHDRLDEFESFVDEMRHEYTASLKVWDNTLKAFIFYKRALSSEPETDMLRDAGRDMRTATRKWHFKEVTS